MNPKRRALVNEIILVALAFAIFSCYIVSLDDLPDREPGWSDSLTAARYSSISRKSVSVLVIVFQLSFVILGMINMWWSEKISTEKRNWTSLFWGIKSSFLGGMILRGWTSHTESETQYIKAWVIYYILVVLGMLFFGLGVIMLERPFNGTRYHGVYRMGFILGVWIAQIFLIVSVVSGSPSVGQVMLIVSASITGAFYAALRFDHYRQAKIQLYEDDEILIQKASSSHVHDP
jgi:hypothetical protein